MKRKIRSVLPFLVMCFVIACDNPGEQPEESTAVAATTSKVHVLDSLEKIFDNDNWMLVTRTDTSFYYFSRTRPNAIKYYHYEMANGDSVHSTLSQVELNGDSITWNFAGSKWLFDYAKENRFMWKGNAGDSLALKKINNKLIEISIGERRPLTLVKTITLSSFLVRSHYDYLHDTRYAFDEHNFNLDTIKDDRRRK